MKRLLIIILIISSSCSSVNRAQRYYYVDALKEQEIILLLKDDSTFTLTDSIGCNQFELSGKYREALEHDEIYFILDSVKLQNTLSNFNSELVFPLKNGDKAYLINKERLSINHQPFKKTAKVNINLKEIRYKKIKEYYTEYLGTDGFLKIFGNGSKRQAKKRLLDCKLPDMKFK